jgi:hypothetical protein
VGTWRVSLSKEFALDDQYLPRASFVEHTGLFLPKLLDATDCPARCEAITEEAIHLAWAEVNSLWRGRFQRRAERCLAKIGDAIERTLSRDDVRVTGREMKLTLTGYVHGARAAIPSECLVHAGIDVEAGTIAEGNRRWCDVVVSLPPTSASAAQNCTPPAHLPAGGPTPPMPRKGEIPDGAFIEIMLQARKHYKSWNAVIDVKIDLNQVKGQSLEAKRKRLVKKASREQSRRARG